MSDTPETDDQPIIYAMNDLCYQVLCVDLEFARRLERERNEARVEQCSIQCAFEESQDKIEKLERERDKWEETARLYCQNSNFHREMCEKAECERDEARAAIPAGEWVAYKDHQKIHDAASRLLVAINKQLPIGCFILINSEYHRLQNAIYGREGAK